MASEMTMLPQPEAHATPRCQPRLEVRALDPSNPTDTLWAARMHLELFGDIGMIARLGERVLDRFCYARLVKDGLMVASVAVVDGRPAGLSVFASDSQAVFRAILGSHFPLMVREVIAAAILSPRILLGFPQAARLVWERRTERLEPGRPVAEMLAFGVREEFRHHDFIRATGLRVSEKLLYHTLTTCRAMGIREGRGVVLARNRPAVAFLRMRARRVAPYANAAQPSVEVWYDLDHALRLLRRGSRARSSDAAPR
jgi:hypothetical protein